MKAVTFRSYGPPSVLKLKDLPKPYPKEAANPWAVRLVFGFFKPRNPVLGSVFAASIDKIYPLEDLVQAHTYADLGHKRGNVVIEIHRNNDV